MDAHSSLPDDNLNELEQRLSAWRPGPEGLDPDSMLFAAGRASVRASRGQFVWPTLAGCMTLLAAVLGGWLLTERTERLALAQQLQQRPFAPASALAVAPRPMEEPAAADELPSNGYWATRRMLEQGLDGWPDRALVQAPLPGPPPLEPPIPQVGQRNEWLGP